MSVSKGAPGRRGAVSRGTPPCAHVRQPTSPRRNGIVAPQAVRAPGARRATRRGAPRWRGDGPVGAPAEPRPPRRRHPSPPAEPIEAIDPADPMLRIDPAEPMEAIDPADPTLRIDPADPTLRIDPADPTHHMLRVEATDRTDSAEQYEPLDRHDPAQPDRTRSGTSCWTHASTEPLPSAGEPAPGYRGPVSAATATAPKLRKALKRRSPALGVERELWEAGPRGRGRAWTRWAGARGPAPSRSAPPCCRRTGGSTRSATPRCSPRPSARPCSTASPAGAWPGRSATPREEECDELGHVRGPAAGRPPGPRRPRRRARRGCCSTASGTSSAAASPDAS